MQLRKICLIILAAAVVVEGSDKSYRAPICYILVTKCSKYSNEVITLIEQLIWHNFVIGKLTLAIFNEQSLKFPKLFSLPLLSDLKVDTYMKISSLLSAR